MLQSGRVHWLCGYAKESSFPVSIQRWVSIFETSKSMSMEKASLFNYGTPPVKRGTVKLSLWPELNVLFWRWRFRSIAKSYFRRCDGVVLVYDSTYERSFLNVREWIETINDATPKKVSVMIVANKIDLRDQLRAEGRRVIEQVEGARLAKVRPSRENLSHSLHRREMIFLGISSVVHRNQRERWHEFKWSIDRINSVGSELLGQKDQVWIHPVFLGTCNATKISNDFARWESILTKDRKSQPAAVLDPETEASFCYSPSVSETLIFVFGCTYISCLIRSVCLLFEFISMRVCVCVCVTVLFLVNVKYIWYQFSFSMIIWTHVTWLSANVGGIKMVVEGIDCLRSRASDINKQNEREWCCDRDLQQRSLSRNHTITELIIYACRLPISLFIVSMKK